MTTVRKSLFGAVGVILLLLVLGVALLPFLVMGITSIQDTNFVGLAFDPALLDFSNYTRLFTTYGFGSAIATSAIVVVLACTLNLFCSSLAAFAFAKKPFPGSNIVFVLYLATMMVPGQVTLIPMFTIMRELGLLNTYISLALPAVGAFGVFLIRQFMITLPDDMLEAARIDGASDLRIFFSIVLPLIRPVLVALTVFTFISTWNDFLWPLVSISDDRMQTITLAAAKLSGRVAQEYGLIMAGAAVAFAVPLVMYLFLQRQFVEGIAATGLKG